LLLSWKFCFRRTGKLFNNFHEIPAFRHYYWSQKLPKSRSQAFLIGLIRILSSHLYLGLAHA
jgi:hypothetical protein